MPTGLRSSLRESWRRAPNTPGGTPCCSTRRTSGSPIPRSVGSRSPSTFLPPTATGPLGVGDQCAVSEGRSHRSGGVRRTALLRCGGSGHRRGLTRLSRWRPFTGRTALNGCLQASGRGPAGDKVAHAVVAQAPVEPPCHQHLAFPAPDAGHQGPPPAPMADARGPLPRKARLVLTVRRRCRCRRHGDSLDHRDCREIAAWRQNGCREIAG